MTRSFLWAWSFDRHYYRLRRSFVVVFLWELSLTCHTMDGRLGFCGEGWLAGSQCLPHSLFSLLSHFPQTPQSSVADPNFFHPGFEFFPFRIRIFSIPDPYQRIEVFWTKKLLLCSRKNDLGCSSQIRIPDPDPGSGSRIRIRNTASVEIGYLVLGTPPVCTRPFLFSIPVPAWQFFQRLL